ncbi:unnamed protein product [Moneuplotes crassus]|uniref:Uncharacterized protein n=1 Tax=Euplotes crassus TaxID=5936 RepID=A0AAD1XUD6_EUPCR|nr:unnamed protein product [Moneuplotes crassus]
MDVKKRDLEVLSEAYENVYYNSTMAEVPEEEAPNCDISFRNRKNFNIFFKKMMPIRLGKIKMLFVCKEINQKNFQRLLKNNLFIKEISEFIIEFSQEKICYLSPYFKHLMQIIPRVKTKLALYRCTINRTQFRKILQVGKHIQNLEFNYCTFNSAHLHLDPLSYSSKSGANQYSTKSLTFRLPKFPPPLFPIISKSLKSLLQAASCTTLKSSLETLSINNQALRQEAAEIAQELGFKNLVVKS